MPPRRVTLTFDNGPTPGITERVLEILERQGIRSTFFVIGRNLAAPEAASLARQAHAAGHWIGNHTFSHSVALGDRPEADFAEHEIADDPARDRRIVSPEQTVPAVWKLRPDRPASSEPRGHRLPAGEPVSDRALEQRPRRLEGCGGMGR